ncbi:MAG TPA: hypothetical protein VF842_13795, partial [Flavobacterium sp.]
QSTGSRTYFSVFTKWTEFIKAFFKDLGRLISVSLTKRSKPAVGSKKVNLISQGLPTYKQVCMS